MSQVTKPIALDETLRDVVSAIQGITQGGMIVSTGNVGSATQPVYINGGVPTAIDGVPLPKSMPETTNLNDAPAGWAVFGTNATNNPFTFGGTVLTMYAVSTSYWQQIAFPWGSGTKRLAYRVKDNGTWGSWGEIGAGITTGTPTNINSNCSLRSGDIVKSGNVVNLRIALTINTTFTPSSSTTLFKLPWTPTLTYPQFDRVLEDSGSFYELGKAYANGANVACGKASNYGVFTAGRIITINGTYITSD